MTRPFTHERIGAGWVLIHLPPNPSGYRVLEAQHDGPDGTWRVCPYGCPELETFRTTLRSVDRLAEDTVAGLVKWV